MEARLDGRRAMGIGLPLSRDCPELAALARRRGELLVLPGTCRAETRARWETSSSIKRKDEVAGNEAWTEGKKL